MYLCQQCSKELTREQVRFKCKYCSRSCSAKHSNSIRPKIRPKEIRKKVSDSLKLYHKTNPSRSIKILCKISFCQVCNGVIRNRHGKVCSKPCQNLLAQRTSKHQAPATSKLSPEQEIIRRYKIHCSMSSSPVAFDEFASSLYSIKNKDYKRYSDKCRFKLNITDIQFIKGYNLYMKHGPYTKDNKQGMTKDHKVSILYGFINNIDPTILSHPANCEFMSKSKNCSKERKCSITLDQLFLDIKNWRCSTPAPVRTEKSQ